MISLSDLIPQIAGFDQRKYIYKPRPSMAGNERCIRSMVYNAMGAEPKPLPGRSILVMDDSSWHEELSLDWLKKSVYKVHSAQMGVNCADIPSIFLTKKYNCHICKTEVPAYTIHGHIDGIITDGDGIDHLLEHKAINHFTFNGYETGDLIPYDYICQTCLYQNALENILGKDLGFAILWIKNKNTAQYMEYHIEYDFQTDIAKIEIYRVAFNSEGFPKLQFVKEAMSGDVIKGAIAKFLKVEKYVTDKKLPKRQYEIDNWRCQYCGWKEVCWANYDKEIEDRKEGVVIKDSNILNKVSRLDILKENISVLETESEGIKSEIKTMMIDKSIKTAIAKDFLIRLEQKERKELDKKLLPVELVQQATKITKYESLSIKKIKGETKND